MSRYKGWKIKVEAFNPLYAREWCLKKTVGQFKRKTKGRTYISPKIILNSSLNHLIGRKYDVYVAKVKILSDIEDEWESDRQKPSEALILVFS